MEKTNLLQQEIKQLALEKKLAEEKYDLITSATIDAIIIMTEDGKISLWNPAAEKIFGYKQEEILGKDLHLVVAPKKYHEAYKLGYQKFKKSGKGPLIGKLLELTAVKKDGSEFPIGLSLSSTKVGKSWISIGIVRDITLRKKNEKALQKAHLDLEKQVKKRTAQLQKANKQLKRKAKELAEANVALKILLKKSSEAGKEIEEKILNNIDELVHPYIDELALKLKNHNNTLLLKIVKNNLDKISSSFAQTLLIKYRNLTPREIQVADLIRHGRSTKEIAQILNVGIFTVETYRSNLRNKFKLKNKKVNLRSYLKSIITD